MLKIDFHTHTNYVQENVEGRYSPKELIDRAKELGFDALCISEHGSYSWYGGKQYFDYFKSYKDFKDYASSKGILLISGVEAEIEGKEVLLVNFKGDITKINTFEDLRKLDKSVLVIAPHPFFFYVNCLGKRLIENIDLFDAIEYSHFYCRWFNVPNKRAEKVALKYKKPMVGNSDAHRMFQIGRCYSLVDAEKNVDSIIKAVRGGKVKVVSKPLSLFRFVFIAFNIITMSKIRKFLYKIKIIKI